MVISFSGNEPLLLSQAFYFFQLAKGAVDVLFLVSIYHAVAVEARKASISSHLELSFKFYLHIEDKVTTFRSSSSLIV